MGKRTLEEICTMEIWLFLLLARHFRLSKVRADQFA
jgi:hypothetical protein